MTNIGRWLVAFGAAAAADAAAQVAETSAPTSGLEEVVVTAQKQSEELQRTAAAVTVLDSSELIQSGVSDLRQAQMLTPSVRFQAEQNNTQVFIRGVGANLDFANVEQSVGFVINGAYVPREGTSAAFFDLAQLEVLPGPQGTLYGRSSIGGTVALTSNRPAQNWDGNVLLELDDYSGVHVGYAQNIPLTGSLALRGALDYRYHEGYNESGGDSKDDYGVRLSGVYEPSDDLSVFLWAHYSEKNGHPANLVNKGFNLATGQYCEDCFLHDDEWDDTRTGDLAPLAPFGSAVADEQQYETFMAGGQIDWSIGPGVLTYIPSYYYVDSAPNYWLGTIRARLATKYNQVANELRYSNPDSDGIRYLAGIYLYRVRSDNLFTLFTNPSAPVPQPFNLRSVNIHFNQLENAAAFGQLTFPISDRLRLIAGGRYSVDKREADGLSPDPVGAQPFTFDRKFTNFDWKAGVEYDVGGESLLYAQVQTGSKPGTYNIVPDTPEFDNLVKPTDLMAFTAGYKTRLLDNRLQVNTEVYYYDYEDIEVQSYDISSPFNEIFNAQKIEIYGAQLDVLYAVTADARVNLNVGYSHARNEEFITPAGEDFSGLEPAYAPDWTVLAGYNQGFSVGRGTLRARIDARFESEWWADYVHNPGTMQDDSWKADASLTYEAPANWTVGLWIKNITNEAVLAATAAAGIPGPATAYLESPRTYGLRATFDF
jgi:iron complex outermembrane receptor protein